MGNRPRSAASLPWVSLDTAGFRPLLQAPVIARSAHFVVHHQATLPLPFAGPTSGAVVQDLSTESGSVHPQIVDNSADSAAPAAPILGVMVPKRHAKRSVTRNLIKRQARAAVQSAVGLSGAWLVRLRQPISLKRFPSASSPALRAMVHAELDELMAQIAQRRAPRAAA